MKTIAKLIALAALIAAPLFAQPSGNTLPRNNPAFSGTLTGPLEVLNQPGIATTSTDALTLQNATASTSGATVQYSPRLHFVGHAWNLTATAADNYLDVIEELRPASASVPTAALTWSFRRSTAGTGSFVDFGSMEPNSTTGGLLFKALGTNQSITLMPSGSGAVIAGTNVVRSASSLLQLQGASAGVDLGDAAVLGDQVRVTGNSARNATFTGGHLLLGGLTTDGTGVLQFPTGAADATSGITMASGGLNIFASSGTLWRARSSASDTLQLILGGTSGDALAILYNGTTSTINNGRVGSLLLQTNNTTALTLDSSQNYITAAGHIAKFTNDTTTSITLSAVHDFVTVSNAGAVTVNLPALASNQGRVYHIKNVGAGTATLDPNSSENLFSTSAVATYALATGDAVEIIAMPSWWAIY